MNKLPRILLIALGIAMVLSGIAKVGGALAEEAAPISIETAIELNDGSGNPVATLTARSIDVSVERQVTVAYTLTNHGEQALTQLNYDLQYFDADGNALREKPIYVMIGLMYEPVLPGESRDFEKTHYFDTANAAASVELIPDHVKDIVELPPWTEPRPGNLLLDFCNYEPFTACFENLDTNPVVEMTVRRDEAEADAPVTDPDAIMAELESLKNMRIGEEADYSVTDSGIYYTFTRADGTTWGVAFEAPGLFCWHGKVYQVLHD